MNIGKDEILMFLSMTLVGDTTSLITLDKTMELLII